MGAEEFLGATLARGFAQNSVQWPLVRSSILFELRYGKALVETSRRPGTVPVFGTNGRCGSHDTALFEGPGVVCGRKGQGPLGVEWVDSDYWVIDTAYSLKPLRDDVDLKFAYYLVKYVGLNHLKDGTSNPSLSRDTFGSQLFPVPPLPEQRAIARILGALDDKIELNRKMNATLEAMARALFKSWFVDFDPVRAKAEGRAPSGMDAETANLFPSDFVESELGLIPRGWDPSTLERYADLNSETWARMTYPDSIQYVDLSGTKWGVIESLSFFSREDAPSRAQRVLRRGDTILGTVRPGNGSFALVDRDGLTGSTGFAVLRPRRPEARTFVYFAATSSENIDRLAHLADGGAYPAVRPEQVVHTAVTGAPDNVVTRFEAAVASIMDRIASSCAESAGLARVRDELLPRLLSGELAVSDAEHRAGAVA
jgi:type I restriction enzyme S subunit